MDFISLAKKRHSVRKYTAQKVEQEKLDLILAAAHVAPTAANRQPQRIIVVQSEAGLAKISEAVNLHGAPCALIICTDNEQVWQRVHDGKKVTDIDAAIVTDHMMLEAADLDLGSVWICGFKPDVIRAKFSLPDHIEPVNILAIGYSAVELKSPDRHEQERKPLSDTVFYETLS